MDNLFIAFEGIDGCGKTTQLKKLEEWLTSIGEKVVATKEPTDGPHGSKVREAAVSGNRLPLVQESALLMKDRLEHVERIIKPSLALGEWVLTDRYYYSMVAYQGASGERPGELLRLNKNMFPAPDLTFLFCGITPKEAAIRIGNRGDGTDAFEQIDYQEKVYEIFQQIPTYPDITFVKDEDDPDTIHEDIKDTVIKFSRLKEKINEGLLTKAMARDLLITWKLYKHMSLEELLKACGYVKLDSASPYIIQDVGKDILYYKSTGMTEGAGWTRRVTQATKMTYKEAARQY